MNLNEKQNFIRTFVPKPIKEPSIRSAQFTCSVIRAEPESPNSMEPACFLINNHIRLRSYKTKSITPNSRKPCGIIWISNMAKRTVQYYLRNLWFIHLILITYIFSIRVDFEINTLSKTGMGPGMEWIFKTSKKRNPLILYESAD